MRKRNKRSSIFYYHLYLCRWKWHPTHHQHILPSNWILDFTRQRSKPSLSLRKCSSDELLWFSWIWASQKKLDISFSHTWHHFNGQKDCAETNPSLIDATIFFWTFYLYFDSLFLGTNSTTFQFQSSLSKQDLFSRQCNKRGTNFPAVNWESSKELILHPQSFFR